MNCYGMDEKDAYNYKVVKRLLSHLKKCLDFPLYFIGFLYYKIMLIKR